MRSSKTNFSFSKKIMAAVLLWAVGAPVGFATDAIDPALISAMEWRLVGPYRGGRVTTVARVPFYPHVSAIGATGARAWHAAHPGL